MPGYGQTNVIMEEENYEEEESSEEDFDEDLDELELGE